VAHVAILLRQMEDSFGRCDVIVSNAATGVIGSFENLDERAWSWTMDANARALMLLVKGALPFMSPGGRVVALSSQGATRVLPGYTVVGASKAAIESLARYLAVELGSRDVTVNVVSPGVVETDALRHFPNRDRIIGEACAKTPLRRLVRPEDVANAVDFLTSPGAEVITGQVLVVDGGASLLA
jgi:enoyl-[acyl-carrier protein] reductase III